MNFNLSLFSSTKEHTFKPLLASNIPIRARTQHDDTMRYDQPAKSQLDKKSGLYSPTAQGRCLFWPTSLSRSCSSSWYLMSRRRRNFRTSRSRCSFWPRAIRWDSTASWKTDLPVIRQWVILKGLSSKSSTSDSKRIYWFIIDGRYWEDLLASCQLINGWNDTRRNS